MAEYFIAYNTMTPDGRLVGSGGTVQSIERLPRDLGDVKRIGDELTEQLRANGFIQSRNWVNVVAWSEMD